MREEEWVSDCSYASFVIKIAHSICTERPATLDHPDLKTMAQFNEFNQAINLNLPIESAESKGVSLHFITSNSNDFIMVAAGRCNSTCVPMYSLICQFRHGLDLIITCFQARLTNFPQINAIEFLVLCIAN